MNSTTKPALSLVVASGPHEGRAIPLVLPFVIGRAAGCHLRPASALVSHEHCRIEGAPQRRSGGDTVVAVRAEGETVTDRDHMTEDEAARLLSEGDAADEGTEEHPPVG